MALLERSLNKTRTKMTELALKLYLGLILVISLSYFLYLYLPKLVEAYQWYKISGVDSEPILTPSEDTVDKSIRDFLSLSSKKRPSNDTRK